MYGAINPSTTETLATYGNGAQAFGANGVAPPNVFGGVLGPKNAMTMSMSMTMPMGTETATTTGTATSTGTSATATQTKTGAAPLTAGSVSSPTVLGLVAAVGLAMLMA